MARILDSVIGHEALITNLLESIEAGKFPSSLLLVGPEGVGRKQVALGLAQALMCERTQQACGQCGPCLRAAKDQSEGQLLVTAEKNQIKIEQTRKILDFLHLQLIGKARVVIVDDAHLMNPMAANALLKSIEEPGPSTYFILIAPSRRHVLTTIASRCQVATFGPLTVEQLKKKSDAAEWILKASRGSFSKLEALQSIEDAELRDQALQFLKGWLTDQHSLLSGEWRLAVKDREQAMTMAKYLTIYLRDALMLKQSGEILSSDKKTFINEIAQLDEQALMDMAWSSLKIEKDLRANRDPLMVFEEFWLKSSPFPSGNAINS